VPYSAQSEPSLTLNTRKYAQGHSSALQDAQGRSGTFRDVPGHSDRPYAAAPIRNIIRMVTYCSTGCMI
jgi:hypothetical protein